MARRPRSRPDRWRAAVAEIRKAAEPLERAMAEIEDAKSDLVELQGEYSDWLEGLPEGGSEATRDKLQEIVDFDLDLDGLGPQELIDRLDDLEGVDPPLGFGRD